ncbi:MAG: hypothetical protein ACP5QA_14420 [Phycisphaerae bacterium]
MFGKIAERFVLGTRRMRLVALAGICVAGLAIGAGGDALLAQLIGGNPTPQVEVKLYNPCANLVTCTDPSAPLGLCFPDPSSLTERVPDGTFNPNGFASLRVGNCGVTIFDEPCGEPPVAASCNGDSPTNSPTP